MKKNDHAMRFTKSQILKAKQFRGYERDILSVVLQHDEMYSMEEAMQAIQTYQKRSVL